MGLIKRLTEPRTSGSITQWDCPFCNHVSNTEKGAEKHIEKMHGGRS